MLTADHVATRVRDGVLSVLDLPERDVPRALEIASKYVEIAAISVGRPRDEIEARFAGISVGARERRLALGLRKLIDDRCEYESAPAIDPIVLRHEVFTRVSRARAALGDGETLPRDEFLSSVASELALSVEAVESGLYADLRNAHRLVRFDPIPASALVEAHRDGQLQAVLLRAVKVVVEVTCASPAAYRALFHKLKFLRLLHSIERLEGDGYRLTIDGPFSLFDAVTKYGVQLAMLVPALRLSDAWSLEADIRWGKERKPLTFRAKSERAPAVRESDDEGARDDSLPDDIAAIRASLHGAIAEQAPGWSISVAQSILDLPGIGVCIPDLVATEKKTKRRVYVERTGFWSRDAVWRRVELVEQGLAEPIVFVVSSRLRVSAEVLDEAASGALYVYKGTPSARALWEKVRAVAERPRAKRVKART